MKKLTGLQIQKYLPKTNCKECGSNTCMAFAMKLASKKADLADCPYASDEAKAVLGAAAEPPVRAVSFGKEKSLVLGEETVFYRHEKTYVHQTALAVNIDDSNPQEQIEQQLKTISAYAMERVGETLAVDMIALTQKSGDTERFLDLVESASEKAQRPLVIRSADSSTLIKAAELLKGQGCVLASATRESATELAKAALEFGHVLGVTAENIDRLVPLVIELKEQGVKDMVLEFQTHSLAEQFQTNSVARKAALKDNVKALGYPTLAFLEPEDDLDVIVLGINEITKFGGICVLPVFDPALLVALMTARMNIYTDPQKPIQVEPDIYPVGEPGKDSPVFVTTNFSLTYFIISGEIENAGMSAWLVVPECEGMSVLTSWAAGKFSAASIAKFMEEKEVNDKIESRKLVIPGYVAQLSGELEELLPGWKVLVGPQESADLESYITNVLSAS